MGKRAAPSAKALLVPFTIVVTMGLLFCFTSGTLAYWPAWIYLAVFGGLTLFMAIYLGTKSPELLERRANVKDDKSATKPPAFLNLFLLVYVVPGFDFRFSWSAVPIELVIAANALVFLGYAFIILVFRENSYASSVVRVEGGQKVISTGPYRFVRHPMYTGMLLMTLATPLALGSYWAFLPCAFFVPWLLLRIKGEEQTLRGELAGYSEYCEKTRYRLVPWVW